MLGEESKLLRSNKCLMAKWQELDHSDGRLRSVPRFAMYVVQENDAELLLEGEVWEVTYSDDGDL